MEWKVRMGAGDVLSREQRFVSYYDLYMQQPDGVAFPVGDAIAGDHTPGDFGKLFDLLFWDYETKPRPMEELPLTKYFPSPCGVMVFTHERPQGIDEEKACQVTFDEILDIQLTVYEVMMRAALEAK